jgi:hypothetical protein
MLDRTTKAQLGYDTRPGHKGRTKAGAILSLKGMYQDSMRTVKAAIQSGDARMAAWAIEMVDGKPGQNVNLKGDVTLKTPPTQMVVRIAKD